MLGALSMADGEAMREYTVRIVCDDGYPLGARVFAPPSAAAAMVIAPALAVPARFYAAYARFLAEQGYAVVVFDYRGSGESAHGPRRGRDMRMSDWGRHDLEAVLAWTRRELKPARLFLTGHSAGGQLIGLAPGSERLDGVVLVGATAPHLRYYPPRSWPKLLLTWYAMVPLLSRGRDRFPTRRTGLGNMPVASGAIAQWARWARSRDYLFTAPQGLDLSRYAALKMPLLSYCFLDDSYAPPAAVNALLRHYPAARIDRREVARPAQGSIGHFGYFRETQREGLWLDTLSWLKAVCG